jgi:hypothetical protein
MVFLINIIGQPEQLVFCCKYICVGQQEKIVVKYTGVNSLFLFSITEVVVSDFNSSDYFNRFFKSANFI